MQYCHYFPGRQAGKQAGGRAVPHSSCFRVPLPPVRKSATISPTVRFAVVSTGRRYEPREMGTVAFTFARWVSFHSAPWAVMNAPDQT